MKKNFSASWLSSSQPRKQRKYIAKAPLHLKHKLLAANLNKEIRKKYQRRSFPLRKGDTVRIMRGKFSGKTGKIAEVDLRRTRVSIEGVQRQKKDGTKIAVYFHPSKLQIQELDLDDKERIKSIERKIKKPEQTKIAERKETKIEEKKAGEKENKIKVKKIKSEAKEK